MAIDTDKKKENGGKITAVQVALRVRPFVDQETQPRPARPASNSILRIHGNTVHVTPVNKRFMFDHIFGPDSDQKEIFDTIGQDLVDQFIKGYNVTLLAHGQSLSGKTYTMGTAQHQSDWQHTRKQGILPRAMALLFDTLHQQYTTDNTTQTITPLSSTSSSIDTFNTAYTASTDYLGSSSRMSTLSPNRNRSAHSPKLTVKVSFVEICHQELHDLLGNAPTTDWAPIALCQDAKGQMDWTSVENKIVHSVEDVLDYLEQGTRNRAANATNTHKLPQSHAIFSVSLQQENYVHSISKCSRPLQPTTPSDEEGEWVVTQSTFLFVDLAGGQHLKSRAPGDDRHKEGIHTDPGLLALAHVISALGDLSEHRTHIPYHDSILTRLLQDSLGGSATTLIMACVSPAESDLADTLDTLQCASHARNIKNRVQPHQVEAWTTTDDVELLRNMVATLRANTALQSDKPYTMPPGDRSLVSLGTDTSHPISLVSSTTDPEQVIQEQRLIIADLQRQVEELDGELAVARAHKTMVEAESQLDCMQAKQAAAKAPHDHHHVAFQHLVEPVIAEYEKNMASLESQLTMARATLQQSNQDMQDHQSKLRSHERALELQEQTILDLQTRLNKALEREQSNEDYIEELETKLMRSAADARRDQDLANQLKAHIAKLKEKDESTEQYIANLEQRLATSEGDKSTLAATVEEMEIKLAEKERANEKLRRQWTHAQNATTQNTDTQKMLLKELDELTAKLKLAEKERDQYKSELEQWQDQQQAQTNLTNGHAAASDGHLPDAALAPSPSPTISSLARSSYRRSFAEEKETSASAAALAVQRADQRAASEAARALRLETEIGKLHADHQQTLKELDEVLVRYQEALEQVDHLQRVLSQSHDDSDHDRDTFAVGNMAGDLSREMDRAKEEEREMHLEQIANLEQRVTGLRQQLEEKQNQLDAKDAHLAVLENTIHDTNALVAQLEKARANHSASEAALQTKADDATKLVDSLQAKVSALNATLEQQVKEYEVAIARRDQTLSELEATLTEKTQEIHDFTQALTALKKTISTAPSTTVANIGPSETQANVQTLVQAVKAAFDRQLTALQDDCHCQEQKLKDAQQALALAEQDRAQNQQTLLETQQAYKHIEQELLMTKEALSTSQHALEQMSRDLAQTKLALEDTQKRRLCAEQDLAQANQTDQHAVLNLAQTTQALKESQDAREHAEQELYHVKQVLEQTAAELLVQREKRASHGKKPRGKTAAEAPDIKAYDALLSNVQIILTEVVNNMQQKNQIDMPSRTVDKHVHKLKELNAADADMDEQTTAQLVVPSEQAALLEPTDPQEQPFARDSATQTNGLEVQIKPTRKEKEQDIQSIATRQSLCDTADQLQQRNDQWIQVLKVSESQTVENHHPVAQHAREQQLSEALAILQRQLATYVDDAAISVDKQAALERAIKTTEQHAHKLEQQVEMMTHDKEQRLRDIHALELQCQSLEQQLTLSTQECQQQATTLAKMHAVEQQCHDLEQRLLTSSVEKDNVLRDLSEIKMNHQRLIEEHDAMSTSLDHARATVKQLNDALKHKESDMLHQSAKTDQEERQLNQALDASRARIDVLEKQLHALAYQSSDREMRSIRGTMDKDQVDHDQPNNNAQNEANPTVTELDHNKMSAYQQQLALLEQKARHYEQENEEYATLSKEFENVVRRLREELDKTKDDLEESQWDVYDRENRVASLEASLQDLERQASEMKQGMQQVPFVERRNLAAAQSCLADAQLPGLVTKETADLLTQLTDLKSENARLKAEIAMTKQAQQFPAGLRTVGEIPDPSSETAPVPHAQKHHAPVEPLPGNNDTVVSPPSIIEPLDDSKDQVISALKQEVNELQRVLERKKAALDDIRRHLEHKTHALDQVDQEMEELRTQLASTSATAEEQKQLLESELSAARREQARLTRAVAALEKQLENARSKKSRFMCF